MNTGFTKAAILAGLLACGASVSAATIYDNTDALPVPAQRSNSTGVDTEVGDRITFSGTDRILTDWSFEYWVTPGSTISGQAHIYSVDASGNPGTLLYQSLIEANLSTLATAEGYGTFNNTGVTPVTLPDEVIWTVLFSGVEAGEEFGLLFNGAAEVGSSGDFYLLRTGPDWAQATTGMEDTFAARFNAVPEPSTWALLVGGLGLLSFWSFRRKA